jgi:hypothetical protein
MNGLLTRFAAARLQRAFTVLSATSTRSRTATAQTQAPSQTLYSGGTQGAVLHLLCNKQQANRGPSAQLCQTANPSASAAVVLFDVAAVQQYVNCVIRDRCCDAC